MAFFLVALKVEFRNEWANVDCSWDVEVLWEEGHPRGEMDEPLTCDIIGDGEHPLSKPYDTRREHVVHIALTELSKCSVSHQSIHGRE